MSNGMPTHENSANEQSQKTLLSDWTIALLQNGKSIVLRAFGYSMYPAIQPDWEIQIDPVKIDAIKIGNIVAFKRKDYLIVHRVINTSILQDKCILTTKGDSEFKIDEPVDSNNFVGLVTKIKNKEVLFLPTQPYDFSKKYTVYCWIRKKISIHFNLF
jgi:signal peptidase I